MKEEMMSLIEKSRINMIYDDNCFGSRPRCVSVHRYLASSNSIEASFVRLLDRYNCNGKKGMLENN